MPSELAAETEKFETATRDLADKRALFARLQEAMRRAERGTDPSALIVLTPAEVARHNATVAEAEAQASQLRDFVAHVEDTSRRDLAAAKTEAAAEASALKAQLRKLEVQFLCLGCRGFVGVSGGFTLQ